MLCPSAHGRNGPQAEMTLSKERAPTRGRGAVSELRNGSEPYFLFDRLLLNCLPEGQAALAGLSQSAGVDLRTLALVVLLASRSAQAQADFACPRRFWRWRPRGPPLWRIARTDLLSTWDNLMPRSRYQRAFRGSNSLFKVAHLDQLEISPRV